MSYAEITFQARNPVKRWLQKRRLLSAINLANNRLLERASVCDFGSGNGELCKLLVTNDAEPNVTCYEPAQVLMNEAQANLGAYETVRFVDNINLIEKESFDIVFCLEVFEHLPPDETEQAIKSIQRILKSNGTAIIGVPVEIGIPALYKGIFRMFKRFGANDAKINNILSSMIYSPPVNRPVAEIGPGLSYHFEHMGFDYRKFRRLIARSYTIKNITTSPFKIGGVILMPEVYYVLEKNDENRDVATD